MSDPGDISLSWQVIRKATWLTSSCGSHLGNWGCLLSQDNLPYGYFSLVRHLLLDSDLVCISLKFSPLTHRKVDLTSDYGLPSASLCYVLIAFHLSRNEVHWQRGHYLHRVGRLLYGIISGTHRKFLHSNITWVLTAPSLFPSQLFNGCGSISTLCFQRLRVTRIEGNRDEAKTVVSNYYDWWPFGFSLSYTDVFRGIYWLEQLGNAVFYALRHSWI